MADITLDPDDPNPSVATSATATAAAAWAWAALASRPAVEKEIDDASSQAIANKDASATKILQQPQQQVRPLCCLIVSPPDVFGLVFPLQPP